MGPIGNRKLLFPPTETNGMSWQFLFSHKLHLSSDLRKTPDQKAVKSQDSGVSQLTHYIKSFNSLGSHLEGSWAVSGACWDTKVAKEPPTSGHDLSSFQKHLLLGEPAAVWQQKPFPISSGCSTEHSWILMFHLYSNALWLWMPICFLNRPLMSNWDLKFIFMPAMSFHVQNN